MSYDKPIHRVAIVGTGHRRQLGCPVLARGLDVVATDPAPNAENEPAQVRGGRVASAHDHRSVSRRVSGPAALHRQHEGGAVAGDFVQENGPERPEFKIKLFADMDDATPRTPSSPRALGITMSVMQSKCAHAERCVVGHPSILPTSSRWSRSSAARRRHARPSSRR